MKAAAAVLNGKTSREVETDPGSAATSAESNRRAPGSDPADYPARALTLAGAVLAPERRSPSNLKLGQLLLRESLLATARENADNPALASLAQAIGEIESTGMLARVAGSAERGYAILDALRPEVTPSAEGLHDAEAMITALLRRPTRDAAAARRTWRRRWLLAVLLVVTVAGIMIAPRRSPPVWAKYKWKTSSTAEGFPSAGTLRDRGTAGLIFHTANERNPWVVIDMLAPRSVQRIVLKHRSDCCYERGLPLLVEVGLDETSFAPVGRQYTLFDTWDVDFSARQARYIRIRSESTTTLHLREIQVP